MNEFEDMYKNVRDICDEVNEHSRYTWEPCLGWINPDNGSLGVMCATEYGRIYIGRRDAHKGGLFDFYIYWVDGDNSPCSDNGRHVKKDVCINADMIDKIMLESEDINAFNWCPDW